MPYNREGKAVYLLHGEETYLSQQKLKEIRTRFVQTHKDNTDLVTIKEAEFSFEAISRAVLVRPLLARKRMIVIEDFVSQTNQKIKKQVAEFLEKIPKEVIIVFYERKEINSNDPLLTKIKTLGRVQKFNTPSLSWVLQWAEKEVKNQGGAIEKGALERLVQITGINLWRLSLEINKLVSYCSERAITKEDVALLVKEEAQPRIFELIDLVGNKNFQKAAVLLSDLISSGENEGYILSMIAYQVRNLLIIKDLLERKQPLQKSGIHPYALKRLQLCAKNFSQRELKEIYQKLVETDIKIKKGILEPQVALEVLLSEMNYEIS